MGHWLCELEPVLVLLVSLGSLGSLESADSCSESATAQAAAGRNPILSGCFIDIAGKWLCQLPNSCRSQYKHLSLWIFDLHLTAQHQLEYRNAEV